MATQASPSEAVLLETNVTIASVSGLQLELLTRLEQGIPIRLDAGAVERADAAALQLFCALFRSAEVKGVPCTWTAASDSLREAAQLLGLEQVLGLPA